jgi:hypothetical protein
MKAAEARRGIRGYDTKANAPPGINALAYGGNFANDLVTENRGRLNHLGVVAALPDFEVGAIGERKAHAQQNFVRSEWGDIDLFETQIFAPVQHGGHHL